MRRVSLLARLNITDVGFKRVNEIWILDDIRYNARVNAWFGMMEYWNRRGVLESFDF